LDLNTRWIEHFAKVAEDKQPVDFIEHAEGLGKHYKVNAFPTAKDGVVGVVFEDITEILNFANEFEKQSEMFKEVFMRSPAATFLCAIDGIIIEVNDSAQNLLGFPEINFVGKKCADFSHPEDIGSTLESAIKAKRTGIPQRFQKRYMNVSGETLLCDCTLNFIDNGVEDYFIMQFIDITDRQGIKKHVLQTLDDIREIAARRDS
jgi:PAS domain S-box-containing protein